MQSSHALHDDCETAIRDHHHWMGILLMLVSKQTIKITELANCCVGEAEHAGQTVMEKEKR